MLTIQDNKGTILAYLNNLQDGNIHQIINGEYVLNFTAIVEEFKTEYLYNRENLIVYNNDYFRVLTIEELHNEASMLTIGIEAEHISYDLLEQYKKEFSYQDKAAIHVMNAVLQDTDFIFLGTDVTTTESIEIETKEDESVNVRNILFNIAHIWHGELEYFRKEIRLLKELGKNRQVDFRFGKNINSIKRLINLQDKSVSYDVEVVQGSELQELGYFELGDTIRVIDDALNIDHEVRIVEIEKDIITGINSNVVLGQPISGISLDFDNINNTLIKLKEKTKKLDASTVELADALLGAFDSIDNLKEAVADGIITTYYQDSAPVGVKVGDLWFDTKEGKLYIAQISNNYIAWKLIEDKGVTEAIEAAQNAQDTADGKIKTYFQDSIPKNIGESEGDLWFDTNDGNKLYRYRNGQWVSARDADIAKINNVVDQHGNLIAEKITGTLNTATAKVESATGHVTFDSRGLITHNQPTEQSSTKAVLVSSEGILIANARNPDGSWRWRTAITGDSISANAITTGTLTAINIEGVNITGSTLISRNGNYAVEIRDGKLLIRDTTADNEGLKISYDYDIDDGFATVKFSGSMNDRITMNTYADELGEGMQRRRMYVRTSKYYGALIDESMEWWSSTSGKPAGRYTIQFDPSSQTSNNSFSVRNGSKNAVVETEKFGDVYFSAYETSQIYFGHIGEGKIIDGECKIKIPKKLIACCNMDLPYQVFLQAYGDGKAYISERKKDHFVVSGDDIKFGYEIKCRRKDFEDYNFGIEGE